MARAPSGLLRTEDFPDLNDPGRLDRFFRVLNGFMKTSETALSRGLTVENLAAQRKEMIVTAPDYVAPTFQNGWANFGGANPTAGFYRTGNRVRHKGTVKTGVIGAVIYTVPAGYRPSAPLAFPVVSNAAFGYALVDAAGNVTAMTGSNAWFELSAIEYPTADAPPTTSVCSFAYDLPGGMRPKAVTIERALFIDSNRAETPVSLGAPAWLESGGQVFVYDLQGLVPGCKYRIVFRVEGG